MKQFGLTESRARTQIHGHCGLLALPRRHQDEEIRRLVKCRFKVLAEHRISAISTVGGFILLHLDHDFIQNSLWVMQQSQPAE
jgi:hypothetical protein